MIGGVDKSVPDMAKNTAQGFVSGITPVSPAKPGTKNQQTSQIEMGIFSNPLKNKKKN